MMGGGLPLADLDAAPPLPHKQAQRQLDQSTDEAAVETLVKGPGKEKKRRRSRNALDDTPRYADLNTKKNWHASTSPEDSAEAKKRRSERARGAVAARWDDGHVPEATEQLDPKLYSARRQAIVYTYDHVCHAPSEDKWEGHNGVITEIIVRLDMPEGSGGTVKNVLKDYIAAKAGGSKGKLCEPRAGGEDQTRLHVRETRHEIHGDGVRVARDSGQSE